jgi:hypothetical protein
LVRFNVNGEVDGFPNKVLCLLQMALRPVFDDVIPFLVMEGYHREANAVVPTARRFFNGRHPLLQTQASKWGLVGYEGSV